MMPNSHVRKKSNHPDVIEQHGWRPAVGSVMTDQRFHLSCVAPKQKHLVLFPVPQILSVHWYRQSENNPVDFS